MLYIHRKKKVSLGYIIVVLFLFFSATHVEAQKQLYLEDHDTKPYYFGITLAADMASFRTNFHPQFLQQDSIMIATPVNTPGFSLGLSATARLSNRFEGRFNPQLVFIDRDIYYKLKYRDPEVGDSVTKRIESVLVSFPFQVKFNSDRIGNFRVYMLGGVKVDYDMASNAAARKAEDLVKINKFDYGIEAGVGFNFYFQSFIFSPEIKISNGLGNIHSRDQNLKYSNVLDKINSRMIVFSIHLEG